jgi:arginine exporter protein ArgO
MSTTSHPTRRFAETPVQKAALVYGIVFLIVGLGGFIPGLTSNIESLQFAGHESEAMLLGIFQVSILHNVVHLLYGVVGLIAARAFNASRQYLIWGGAVYAVLWIYGLLVPHDHSANFVPLNTADNWLHFVLAVTMIALGVLLGRRDDRRTDGR